MAVIRRYNPTNKYFPDRIVDRLNSIFENELTVVEAPTGFGKSTAVKHVLSEGTMPYIWFSVDNSDKNKFYSDFCAKIKNLDEGCYKKLSVIGYPAGEDECTNIANILIDINIKEDTILVLDNYQHISDEYMAKILIDVTSNHESKLKIVVLTQVVKTEHFFDLVMKNKVNYIDHNVLAFDKNDISSYCRNCGVKLEDEEADFLFKYTEGWISAVYLQMVQYKNNGKFDINANIDNLMANAIWDKLSIKEQDFLTAIGIFDSFTLRQAIYVSEGKLSEEKVKNLLDSVSLIGYDAKERKYYVHSLLKFFLNRELSKLEPVFKSDIYKRAADWYAHNDEYIKAITYYHKNRDYESIYSLSYDADILVRSANAENRPMFVDILLRTPIEVKEKYPRMAVVYLFLIKYYGDSTYFEAESEVVENIIKESSVLTDRQKEILYGEMAYCRALCEYNVLEKMQEWFIKANSLLKCPSTIYGNPTSWTEGCPSILSNFHRDVGKSTDELELLEETMPYYYRITDGHGKGGDVVMKAEMLLLRGELDGAEVLCQKAIYMSETRKQTSIYIAAMFILARISVFRGDYEMVKDIYDTMNDKIESKQDDSLKIMVDLCRGYISAVLDNISVMPGWLTSDLTIEQRCTKYNLGFANVVYGKYLLMKDDFKKLLGISGQFLGVASMNSGVIYQIYTYIYISVANLKMNNKKKAVMFLKEAASLAAPDGFYIPFVENYKSIESILCEIETEYQFLVSKVNDCERIHFNIEKVSRISLKNSQNFGLTAREYSVAKLAADRLTNKEIAEKLFIAESTVKSNMKAIFSKLSISSRSELSKYF